MNNHRINNRVATGDCFHIGKSMAIGQEFNLVMITQIERTLSTRSESCSAGNRILVDGYDNDIIVGGTGNSTLSGGFGKDILIAGKGKTEFFDHIAQGMAFKSFPPVHPVAVLAA